VSSFGDENQIAKIATSDTAKVLSYIDKNSDKIMQSKEKLDKQLA
jgi:hypothetical protein